MWGNDCISKNLKHKALIFFAVVIVDVVIDIIVIANAVFVVFFPPSEPTDGVRLIRGPRIGPRVRMGPRIRVRANDVIIDQGE